MSELQRVWQKAQGPMAELEKMFYRVFQSALQPGALAEPLASIFAHSTGYYLAALCKRSMVSRMTAFRKNQRVRLLSGLRRVWS